MEIRTEHYVGMGSVVAGIGAGLIGNKILRLSLPASTALGLAPFAAGCVLAVKIYLDEAEIDRSGTGGNGGGTDNAGGADGGTGASNSSRSSLSQQLTDIGGKLGGGGELIIEQYTFVQASVQTETAVLGSFPDGIDTLVFDACDLSEAQDAVSSLASVIGTVIFRNCDLSKAAAVIANLPDHVDDVIFDHCDLSSANIAVGAVKPEVSIVFSGCDFSSSTAALSAIPEHINTLSVSQCNLLGNARFTGLAGHVHEVYFEACIVGSGSAAVVSSLPASVSSVEFVSPQERTIANRGGSNVVQSVDMTESTLQAIVTALRQNQGSTARTIEINGEQDSGNP